MLITMKIYKNTSNGYELSGIRWICPTHGFQFETRMLSTETNLFGESVKFEHFCKNCLKKCLKEKSTEYDIVMEEIK
jgi:NAD-dependent dihydropyrimidine dehydrogenase PreA subunit